MPGADVTAVEFVEDKTDDKGKDEAKEAAGGIKNPKKDGSPDMEEEEEEEEEELFFAIINRERAVASRCKRSVTKSAPGFRV